MEGWRDEWVGGWLAGWMNGWIGEWTDVWVDELMSIKIVGWIDRWKDGWMRTWMIDLLPTTVLRGRNYHSHFTDEEISAYSGHVTGPECKSQSKLGESLHFNLCLQTPKTLSRALSCHSPLLGPILSSLASHTIELFEQGWVRLRDGGGDQGWENY